MNYKLAVVIPVFNRRTYLKNCLLSFRKQSFKNHKIIVVDDGSTDGTKEMLAIDFPEIFIISGNGDLWWTGSINKGIKYAIKKYSALKYILVINDDLEIKEDYIQNLVNSCEKNPMSLIGSVTVDIESPDIIHYGGEYINPVTAKRKVLNKGKNLSDFKAKTLIKVSRLTGRGVLIPVSVFNKIGFYDDKHFKQCGDTEFTVRAKNSGYELLVSYDAVVYSYTKGTDNINTAEIYKFKDFKKYFFNVRSNANLKYSFFYSLNTAKNPFCFLSFFVFNSLRTLYHFFSRVRL